MTLSEIELPVRPLSSWLATPPFRAARREPMENMARGGASVAAAVAVRVRAVVFRPRMKRPK